MDRVVVVGNRFRSHREPIKDIHLHELERIVRLRLDVHADDLEARAVVAHRSTAGAAEEIQQPRPHAAHFPIRVAGAAPTWLAETFPWFDPRCAQTWLC